MALLRAADSRPTALPSGPSSVRAVLEAPHVPPQDPAWVVWGCCRPEPGAEAHRARQGLSGSPPCPSAAADLGGGPSESPAHALLGAEGRQARLLQLPGDEPYLGEGLHRPEWLQLIHGCQVRPFCFTQVGLGRGRPAGEKREPAHHVAGRRALLTATQPRGGRAGPAPPPQPEDLRSRGRKYLLFEVPVRWHFVTVTTRNEHAAFPREAVSVGPAALPFLSGPRAHSSPQRPLSIPQISSCPVWSCG